MARIRGASYAGSALAHSSAVSSGAVYGLIASPPDQEPALECVDGWASLVECVHQRLVSDRAVSAA